MRKLSELEGVSLGLIQGQQPCTAYRVRCELKKAPSSHWQASAGSLYPLLARLEEEGLVASAPDSDDGRGRRLLNVTSAGRKALKQWMLSGTSLELISSVTDPVRSRTFFLGLLGPVEQLRLVDEFIAGLQDYCVETTAHLEGLDRSDDVYEYLGALGAVTITSARLEWLRQVRAQLSNSERPE